MLVTEETKRVMAWMIWGEAEGEDWEGKIAVAQTVTNRLKLAHRPIRPVRWWGWTALDILLYPHQYQGLDRVRKEYGDPRNNFLPVSVPTDCYTIACLELEELLKPVVEGATHFIGKHADTLKDNPSFQHIATIGKHVFYREVYD